MTFGERPSGAIAYAKEVYASCATVGFGGAAVQALKAALDRIDAGGACDAATLVTSARRVQADAIAWAAVDR